MNTKTKRRMVVVTGIIVVVLVVILAVVGGTSSAKNISVSQAADHSFVNQKVQVSGNVVRNSFQTKGNVLTFSIYDPAGDAQVQLPVSFEGGVSATFGNDVTAICTGKLSPDGVLNASDLVTKCPSKYENSSDSLTVSQLCSYGTEVVDKPLKVAGIVEAGTLVAAGTDQRFVLDDAQGKGQLSVLFDGALSGNIQAGSSLILTGSMNSQGKFVATEVALQS